MTEKRRTSLHLKNPVMVNELLPEEEGNGQRSDAVADIRILFCGHTSDTPAELPKDPEILEIIDNGTVPAVRDDSCRKAR